MATKQSAPTYYLGTKQGNAVFLFTELPTFRTGMEASNYYRAHPMQGAVYIFEQRQLSRHGVNFGSTLDLVGTAGA